MSADELVRAVGKATSRRKFLRTVGTGAMTAAAVVVGLPAAAEATIAYKCCNLCRSNSGSCSNCKCVWCWTCCSAASGHLWYRCCECHRDTSYCGSGCSNVSCSSGVRISGHC